MNKTPTYFATILLRNIRLMCKIRPTHATYTLITFLILGNLTTLSAFSWKFRCSFTQRLLHHLYICSKLQWSSFTEGKTCKNIFL